MSFVKTFKPQPLAIALALATIAQGVHAADKPVTFNDLDGELKVLLRNLEVSSEDAKAAAAANPVAVTAGAGGYGLQTLDKNFDLKIRGFVQADGRYFDQGIQGRFDNAKSADNQLEPIDQFLVRRARLTAAGTVYGQYGFGITADFAGGAPTVIDAFVDANWKPYFKVRAGKFVPLIDIERPQSSLDSRFIESSLVTNFLPTRDVGLQITGDFAANTLNYAVGYVNGASDGGTIITTDTDSDKEVQARLVYSPFGALQGLSLGLAGTTSDTHAKGTTATAVGAQLSGYRTIGQETFFTYDNGVNGDGRRTRLIPQVTYFVSSFGIISEYVKEKQAVTLLSGRTEETLEHDGWNITAAWTITGEAQSLKGITPSKNFDGKGGAGAWELVFRAGALTLDEETFKNAAGVLGGAGRFADPTRSAQEAQNVGIGVNWYPNKIVKVAFNYDQTSFTGGGGGAATDPDDRDDERVLIGRVQASF